MTIRANESVAVATSSREELLGDDVIGSIKQEAGQLRQVELSYEPPIKTLWITLAPEPKPVFTYDMLCSLNAVHGAVHKLWGSSEKYNSSPIRFLAFRGRGAVLTLGGDLDFYLDCLARGDRAALAEYARVSVEGVCWNASSVRGTAITLAIVQGKAFGGGIDAPCSCNIVIAETQASFSYPEVKFNHFPITAVSVLSRRAGPRQAHRILSTGDEFSAEQFESLGLLDATVPMGEGESWLRRYAKETLAIHNARLALFCAFNRRAGDFYQELLPVAQMWTESMMRLSPTQISRLQRLAQAQERMLQAIYAAS